MPLATKLRIRAGAPTSAAFVRELDRIPKDRENGMSFYNEVILFVLMCVVLRIAGAALNFIAKWAFNFQREPPRPLGRSPPAADVRGALEPGATQSRGQAEVAHQTLRKS